MLREDIKKWEREKSKGKSVEKPLPFPKIHSRKEKEKHMISTRTIFVTKIEKSLLHFKE